MTPACFDRGRSVVLLAFRRPQQIEVDSWVPWLVEQGFPFFEMPCLRRLFTPVRTIIDGGMSVGVGTEEARRRTVTYYGDLRCVTRPLGIRDRTTITVVALDDGWVVQSVTGAMTRANATLLAG